MKSFRTIALALVLGVSTFTGAMTATSQEKMAPIIELEGRQWDAELESDVRLIRNNIGREFDVDETLGVDDEKADEVILTFNVGNSKLRFSYFSIDFDASRQLTEQVQYDGATYNVGTQVNTNLDFAYGRLGWIYMFGDHGDTFRLGTIVELKAVDFDIDLKAPAFPSLDRSESAVGGLPAFGLALELNPIEELSLYAEASGVTDGGEYGHFVEAEAGVKFTLFDILYAKGGYRHLEFKLEDDLDFVEFELSGAFVGVGVQF